jgi:Flp pilus assembly protein TadD
MRILALAALSLVAAFAAAPVALAQMGGMAPSSSGPAGPDAESFNSGIAAYEAHNYDAAVRFLRDARRPAPNHGGVNYVLGMSYLGLNDKDNAREAFERAVRDRTAPPNTWLQLGVLALEAGDREAATQQQTSLERLIGRCNASCGDERRAALQSAYDQLTQRLAATP